MNYTKWLTGLLLTSPLYAAPIKYEIAPYIWASGLQGSIQIADKRVQVDETFSDILSDLDFGIMVWASANKDRFGVFFNGLYTKVSDETAVRNFNFQSVNKLAVLDGGFSYRFYLSSQETHFFEPIIGTRYTINNTSLSVNQLSAAKNVHWADGIMGGRLNYFLTPEFNIVGTADYGIGNGSHSTNWSALAGYQSPHHFKNARFYIGYRWLKQNFTEGRGRSYYQWDMTISGPVAGALLTF